MRPVLRTTTVALSFAFLFSLSCTTTPQKRTISASAPSFDPSSIERIAIIVQDQTRSSQRGPGLKRVEDELVQVLLQKGYQPLSRSDLPALAKERELQESGLTDDNVATLGRIWDVRAVLIANITAVDQKRERRQVVGFLTGEKRTVYVYVNRASLSARLVDVGTGAINWQGSLDGEFESRNEVDEYAGLSMVAKQLGNDFPPRNGNTPAGSPD